MLKNIQEKTWEQKTRLQPEPPSLPRWISLIFRGDYLISEAIDAAR